MRRMLLSLLGIGVFLGFSPKLYAQPRDQVIAHMTELYGANEAIKLYEEMQVRNAIEAFVRRVNFRDAKSLTGLLDKDLAQAAAHMAEDEKQSATLNLTPREHHWGSPQKREFITTASRDYTVEERRLLHSDLLALFLKIPPNVRFDFNVQNVAVTGNSANAEIIWAFKAREIETPKTKALTARSSSTLELRLNKVGNRWLVSDLKNITSQIASNVVN